MSLCNNIKKFRKLNNYTQKDMALKLNVSQPLIVKWEKDICEPNTDDLQHMADLFSIPVDMLLNNIPVFFKHPNIRDQRRTDIASNIRSGKGRL